MELNKIFDKNKTKEKLLFTLSPNVIIISRTKCTPDEWCNETVSAGIYRLVSTPQSPVQYS